MTISQYYEKVIEKFDFALGDSKGKPYMTRCGIAQGSDEHSYILKNDRYEFLSTQRQVKEIEQRFIDDLKEYLINDKPFKIEYSRDDYMLNDFFERFANYFYQINDMKHYSHPSKYIIPTVDEFEKFIKCFEPTLTSIAPILCGIHKNIQYDISPYVPIVMSLHNEEFFSTKNNLQLKGLIKSELEALSLNFFGEDNLDIVKGVKNYLVKKEALLEKISDDNFENDIYQIIQEIVHSNFWSEVALCLPSLKKKKSSVIDRNIFSNEQNPLFYIHLHKKNIFDISSSVFTEKDFNNMVNSVVSALDETRPDNIDYIQSVHIRDSLSIVFSSSENKNNDMSSDIAKLFEVMISEYNSTNANKNDDENIDYLVKAAKIHWFSLELSKSANNNTEKKRIKL
jgi:hypothetical protein